MARENKILFIGVQSKSKTLLVEYRSGRNKKKYNKKIQIKTQSCKSLEEVYLCLVAQCGDLFSSSIISKEKVIEALGALNLPIQQQSTFVVYGRNTHIEEEEPVSEDLITTIDLNKCSEMVNQKAKEIMSKDFEARRLKPGDEGFEYDKRADFNPSESNEWDEEED